MIFLQGAALVALIYAGSYCTIFMLGVFDHATFDPLVNRAARLWPLALSAVFFLAAVGLISFVVFPTDIRQ